MSEIEPYHEADDDEPEWAGDPKHMGFLEHLEELRWSLLKPIAAFMIAFVASMIFIVDVKDILLAPLEANYSHLSEAERMVVFGGLTTYNVTGVFMAMLLIGVIIGLMVASPFFIYYLGRFLAPALTVREKKILVPGSFSVLFLFLLGCTFGYYILCRERSPRSFGSTSCWDSRCCGLPAIILDSSHSPYWGSGSHSRCPWRLSFW